MFKYLYNASSAAAKACVPVAGIFNRKIKLGANGRERTWDILDQKIKRTMPKIWVHVASLGEFEQVVPILEQLHRDRYQVVLTFFSPSGYEIKKDTPLADVVCYLPIDAVSNVSKFMGLVDPSLAIMVKYEFWPNYLNALKKDNVTTILVSGVFRKDMAFHKWYGSWMKDSLQAFHHFFLQDESSLEELRNLGFDNATISGDTRFDRASQLIEKDNRIEMLDDFVNNEPCLVVGSSWPNDIEIMKAWLSKNNGTGRVKVIIAPHEVDVNSIQKLEKTLEIPSIKWSQMKDHKIADHTASILIIDTIGLLTKAYSYADVAYVGGAMGTSGLHNILEPATHGVPVVIGKNHNKFPEASRLQQLGGLFSISSPREFQQIMDRLFDDDIRRNQTGMICGHWINSNTGATATVVDYLTHLNEAFITP